MPEPEPMATINYGEGLLFELGQAETMTAPESSSPDDTGGEMSFIFDDTSPEGEIGIGGDYTGSESGSESGSGSGFGNGDSEIFTVTANFG